MRKCLSLYHSAKLHNGSNSRLLQASDGPLHWLNTLRLGTGGQVRCFAEAEALQDEISTDRCWPIWQPLNCLAWVLETLPLVLSGVPVVPARLGFQRGWLQASPWISVSQLALQALSCVAPSTRCFMLSHQYTEMLLLASIL